MRATTRVFCKVRNFARWNIVRRVDCGSAAIAPNGYKRPLEIYYSCVDFLASYLGIFAAH